MRRACRSSTTARDLEVTYFVGSTGLGVAVSDRDDIQRIILDLVERAGLESRRRGKIRIDFNGREQVVLVAERDHFGETAFDLRFDRT